MSQTGRNDPCPCGSGRKYKRCCLRAAEGRRVAYTGEDRQRAFALLERQLERPRWRELMRRGFEEVIEGRDEIFESPDLDEYTARGLFDMISDWICFDDIERTGPVHELLRGSIPSGCARFLRGMAESWLRPLEVVGVRPGQTVTFCDLATGTEITVRERTASRTVKPGTLLFGRIAPGSTDLPELERGALPVPATGHQQTAAACDQWRNGSGSLAERSSDLGMELIDIWIDGTLRRWMPPLAVGDGEAMMFAECVFDIVDPAPIVERLGGLPELSRPQDDEAWVWAGSVPAFLRIDGSRLVLEALSVERGESCRAAIEAALGSAVRHRSTTHQHPAQALADLPERRETEGDMLAPEVERELMADHTHRHYVEWLDEQIPALDGATPREAVGHPTLESKLKSLLRGLDHQYLTGLSDGAIAPYDPSWMWDELGLRRHGEREPNALVALGHEVVAHHLEGFTAVTQAVAARRRREPGFDASTVIADRELGADLGAMSLMKQAGLQAMKEGATPESAAIWASIVGAHLDYATNHELHYRKTFQVEDGLAFMLANTDLDVRGEQLQIPFASFALVFRDRNTLALMERALASDEEGDHRGVFLQTLTVYVRRLEADGEGLRLALICDADDGRLPYLLVRDLQFRPDDSLDAVLASHCADVDVESLDPIFTGTPLRDVLRVVMNAILYATSSKAERQTRSRPGTPAEDGTSPAVTELEVVFLPGHLDIGTLRAYQRLERSPSGHKMKHRFMVRGHWRRANPDWKDQSPRWIKPHWRGPNVATIIERMYRLRETEA